MCGIAGIIAPAGDSPCRETLAAMAQAMAHRGPDGQGVSVFGRAGLAHRRLAIIDLACGQQPMTSADGALSIVFNGEIYNYQQLRNDLQDKGHRFATSSDTETILAAYKEYGQDCLEKLRGMFAFAIWDANTQTLFAARDRLGKKPFYYALHQGSFLFASEPSALLRVPGVPREPDMDAVALYLSLQYVPDPRSAFKALRKLPAAHSLIWRDKTLSLSRYWNLRFEPKTRASEDQLTQELQNLVREATRLRLISEVPLGAHLSGGIDSSIVVALMASLSDAPVRTFSIGFKESAFSELHKARAVANRYGTRHQEFLVEFGHVPHALEDVAAFVGEPFADPSALPSFFLAAQTRQHVTVALNGDGGDELFAGYQRYWLDPLAAPLAALPGVLTQKLLPALARRITEPSHIPIEKNWRAGIKRLSQVAAITPKASILRWGSYFTPQKAREMLAAGVRPAPWPDAAALLAQAFDSAHASHFLDHTLAADLTTYLPGDLLVKADRMAMAHGLEGRSPLLDHRLAEWAARLPVGSKMRGRTGKYLLRRAFAHLLPPEVTAQGKQGFGVPVGHWLRHHLAAWSRELLLHGLCAGKLLDTRAVDRLLTEHQAGAADHGKRIWALAALELWARRYAICL